MDVEFCMKRTEFRYVEMAGIMRTEILTGYLKPGEFLLPEKDLCEKYSISRNSLRQALELLTEEGLLVKMVGRGNMVAKVIRTEDPEENTLVVLSPYPSAFAERGLPLLTSMFKEHYPNVNVKLLNTSHQFSAILRDLDGIVKPDIVMGWDRHFRQMGEDEFMPVDDLLRETAEGIHPKIEKAFEKDGAYYAVPVTFSPIFLACNEQLFRSSGVEWPVGEWSLDQFLEAARKMTRDSNGDGLNDIYGFGMSSSLWRWPVFALKHGYRFGFDPDVNVRTQRLSEALSFMQKLVYRDRVCMVTGISDFAFMNEMFLEGRIGMILTSTLSTDTKRSKFPIHIAPLPKREDVPDGSLLIANGLMISKRSRKTELAKLFLKFALRPDFQQRLADETGFLSVLSSVNRKVWPLDRLKAMGAGPEDLEVSGFIHELIPSPVKSGALEKQMKKFWAGMESPAELAEKILKNL
jgi:multiple sugar transport system substrate-binding protein